MTKSIKRTIKDPEWVALRDFVFKRDKGCRLLQVLSAQEFLILRKNAKERLSHLDPAHVLPVGAHPVLCYDKENVVCLNRYSHDNLDSCKNPLTGSPISREDRDAWWMRIIGEELFKKLREKALDTN